MTLSISSRGLGTASSGLDYLYPTLGAVLQILSFIPGPSVTRFFVHALLLTLSSGFAIVPFSYTNGFYTQHELTSSATSLFEHPIEVLARKSKQDFTSMLNRQSKSLQDATREYTRRYDMSPPKGFDQWFEFAKERNSPIIDEFDAIFEAVSPFWKIPPAALRKTIEQAPLQHSNIHRCRFEGGEFMGDCGWQGSYIKLIMGPAARHLPDFEFLLSDHDGPMVLMSDDLNEATADVTFEDFEGQNTWDNITDPCYYQQLGPSNLQTKDTEEDGFMYGLPFIQDAHKSKNICMHPEYAIQHALFQSPTEVRYTRQAVPIMSQAKASTFNDIPMPSVYYYSSATGGIYDEAQDPSWADKTNRRLYWSGTNTGGVNRADVWENFQRHRFVSRANNRADGCHIDEAGNHVSPVETYLVPNGWHGWAALSGTKIPSLYNVKFTAFIQCEPAEVCDAQKAAFGEHGSKGHDVAFNHRLIADIDGNAYSGRFYRLLRSRSAPVKQTIFREWHDDRLYPWVHYLPLSMSLDEMPELMRFLSQTDAGDKIAEAVAEQGRQWYNRAFRWEDFQVYWYRLALEYARLVDEDRVVQM